MIPFFTGFVGLMLGAALGRHGGWFYGLLAGLALGLGWQLHLRYQRLVRELEALRRQVAAMAPFSAMDQTSGQAAEQRTAESGDQSAGRPATDGGPTAGDGMAPKPDHTSQTQPTSAAGATSTMPSETTTATTQRPPITPGAAAVGVTASSPLNSPPAAAGAADSIAARQTAPLEKGTANQGAAAKPAPPDWWRAVQTFFTTGNIMARVGVVVLFFGVAFLFKYVADHAFIPVSLRLIGVAAAGLGMIVIGLRIRRRHAVYSLIVQGGGVGLLYLTTFAAFRLYALLPAEAAFAVLVVVTVLGVLLAVWQNALALAALAVSGGFLAPILVSTGSGDHVALFSYYLVLNLGILMIAWFRSWRVLNLLGFVFTFGIGSLWGARYYQPLFFTSTEPFLVAFFLLYLSVSVLFAFRQPPKLKGYVDGTLVFGLPLAAFALQTELVAGFEYGLAWSSLTLAAVYAVLAKGLWERLQPESRLICEAFTALAVIFATLTLPLALNGQWTSAMWALEGTALVWVGCRQQRLLARIAGYLLQWAAAIAFVYTWADLRLGYDAMFINGIYLGLLTIAGSGLFVAGYLHRRQADLNGVEGTGLARLFLLWGCGWWYAAGVMEIEAYLQRDWVVAGFMLFFAFSSALAHHLQGRLYWRELRFPALSLLPLAYLLLPWVLLEWERPWYGALALAWPLVLVVHYWILRQYDDWQTTYLRLLHMAGLWLVVALLTLECTWWLDRQLDSKLWPQLGVAMVPALLMALLHAGRAHWPWPIRAHPRRYLHSALVPVAALLVIWLWTINTNASGAAGTLPYWPLLNPLDMASVVVLAVLWYWLREGSGEANGTVWRFNYAPGLLAVSVFMWMNSQWLRFAHHYLAVPFDEWSLWVSTQVQAGLSLLWAMTGLGCMIVGHRRRWRPLWLGGAGVMGLVVIKLFLVDLANSGTLERIVSFLSVGVLLLIVGFFAPVPPRAAAADAMAAPGGDR